MSNLQGLTFVVAGVANEKSICWAIARGIKDAGGTVINMCHPSMVERVSKLTFAHSMSVPLVFDASIAEGEGSIAEAAKVVGDMCDVLHGFVHGIAFSDKRQLQGRFVDMTLDNFLMTMNISVFSFVKLARELTPFMTNGGSVVTLTFDGSQRSYANYNGMGPAKAALESATRYLAADFGQEGIRFNSVSPSPERTLSAKGISNSERIGDFAVAKAPTTKRASLEEIAHATVSLLDPRSGINGQNIKVDQGASSTEMPPPHNARLMSKAMGLIADIYEQQKSQEKATE